MATSTEPAPVAAVAASTTDYEYDPSLNETIEADDSGSTSDYSTSFEHSETTSVTSSVKAYIYENGRRYHRYGGQGKYVLPNDETEQDRLDLQHHLCLMILDAHLHTVKLPSNVHRVLDCGTGTGIWALEFGGMHPEAVVTGVDLSPIQPGWVETNVRFEVDDLEKDWTWPDNHFDFIHSRAIINGIRDFKRYIRQMYQHTTPGGVIEISEMLQDLKSQDGTLKNTTLEKFMLDYHECAKQAGFHFPEKEDIVEWLHEAGFKNVEAKSYIVPWVSITGPWARDKRLRNIGHVFAACAETGMEAYGLQLLTTYGGYTNESARAMCTDSMKEIMSGKVHAFHNMVQISARKPQTAE